MELKGAARKVKKDTPMIRWIKTVRVSNGLEQGDLAQHIGKSRSAVGMYETGERVIPAEVIAAILTAFPGTPPPPTGEMSIGGQVLAEDRHSRIRYAGVVPCSSQWGDPLQSDELRPIETKFAGFNRFLCKVAGDSCYPSLQQGDLTIWESDREPPEGCIVLAQQSADGTCTVKELQYDSAAKRFNLVPINPAYEAPPDGEGWECVARLVGVIRTSNGPEITWYWPQGLRREHLV